jgi:acyl carrier protein
MQQAEMKTSSLGQTEIEHWLVSYVAQLRGVKQEKIDVTATFDRFGLDSASAVALSGDLMEWLQCDVEPSVIYDHPTIRRLASHLVTVRAAGARG